MIENADWRGWDENIVGWSNGEKRVQYCNIGQQSLPQVNTKIQEEKFIIKQICVQVTWNPPPLYTHPHPLNQCSTSRVCTRGFVQFSLHLRTMQSQNPNSVGYDSTFCLTKSGGAETRQPPRPRGASVVPKERDRMSEENSVRERAVWGRDVHGQEVMLSEREERTSDLRDLCV